MPNFKKIDEEENSKKSLLDKIRERNYPAIKKDIDDSIYDNVVEPMHKAGFENAGPAIGAGLSAANEFFVPGSDTEAAMSMAGPIVGKLGKLAKPAAKVAEELAGPATKAITEAAEAVPKMFSLDRIKSILSPEKYAKALEDIRLTGSHTMIGPKGEIIGTVGELDSAGKAMKGEARAAKMAEEAAAPSLNYTDMAEKLPKSAPRSPKISGDAAEFMKRTGVDPTRKTAQQSLPELQRKRKEEEELARGNIFGGLGE